MTTLQRMTFTDLAAMPEDGDLHELVRGEILCMPPPKGAHGFIEMALAGAIDRFLYNRAVGLGWDEGQGLAARGTLVGHLAGGEAGVRFSLPDDPDQTRGIDLLYLDVEQVARLGAVLGTDYIPEMPALVAEIVSPSETASYVDEKVTDYLAGGAKLVWLLYPKTRTVKVFQRDGSMHTVAANGTLDGGAVLPGFSVRLKNLFP